MDSEVGHSSKICFEVVPNTSEKADLYSGKSGYYV
jgi:hypothetical protein